jgi:hypothetical protein
LDWYNLYANCRYESKNDKVDVSCIKLEGGIFILFISQNAWPKSPNNLFYSIFNNVKQLNQGLIHS